MTAHDVIAAAGKEGVIRFYMASGEQHQSLKPLAEHTDWVSWLAVDDANQRLYSAGKEGAIRRWDLDYLSQSPDDWLTEACRLLAARSVGEQLAGKARRICMKHSVNAK